MSAVYLGAAIVLEICGTTSLKLSDRFARIGPSAAATACYIVSFSLLSLALRGTWKLLCLALIVLGVAGLHPADCAT
jgi:multidrug transporter EmrE-like cation transporter